MADAQIQELRRQMGALMRQRGIRQLSDAKETVTGKRIPNRYREDLPFFTGYECGRLYGWDQYFEGILQCYAGWDLTYIQNSLKLFLNQTDKEGYIPRTLPEVWWGQFHAQPFLAQQAVLLLRNGDDLAWFSPEYFYRLKHYLMYWLRNLDVRGAGLSVWDHAGHTGMDNQYERAGTFHDAFCEGVDLNSYLVRECEACALLAEHKGYLRNAKEFRDYARQKTEAIQRWCWDEKDGFYYDYHAREDRPIRVKHVGAFAALWARVPNQNNAQRMVKDHLLNPNEFWRDHPLPALSSSEPGYVEGFLPEEPKDCCPWRAHSWMPTNYYTFQGLREYGLGEPAGELARKNREMFCRAPFREYYKADSGAPCGRDPFWGWSSLALYMEEEWETKTDPTSLNIRLKTNTQESKITFD